MFKELKGPWWFSDSDFTFHAKGACLILGQGVKIPQAQWPKKQNKNQKQYFNKFNKDFKSRPHKKVIKKELMTFSLEKSCYRKK